MRFIYGIIIDKRYYGWHKKELYALPFNTGCKYFSLRKLKQIMIGNNVGYSLQGSKFTIEQLQSITVNIDKQVEVIRHSDVPF